MTTVLQYPVGINEFSVPMHSGSSVLSVGMQNGKPIMWALSDKAEPLVPHFFVTAQTGQEVPDEIGHFLFIGTFQSPSGNMSFHLFDAGEFDEDGEDGGDNDTKEGA